MKRTVRWPFTFIRVTAAAEHAAQIGDRALDAVEPLEVALGAPRDHLRQRGLPHAGRPEKNQRREPVGLDQPPQRLARREQMALADVFLQRPGTKPRGQRRVGRNRPARISSVADSEINKSSMLFSVAAVCDRR